MDYGYSHANPTWPYEYVWEPVIRSVKSRAWPTAKAFDLGCGNGFLAAKLAEHNFSVVGVDPSEQGVKQASTGFPHLKFAVGGIEDDLAKTFGTFPLVYSIEVIEHVMDPKLFAKRFYDLLEPSGLGVITTPYHGWLKNVAISVSGKWDDHHGVDWDGGHIKFFSVATLTKLLSDTGFRDIEVRRVGRIPPLAKSMIATFTK